MLVSGLTDYQAGSDRLHALSPPGMKTRMDLDAISQHFFGTTDIDTLAPDAIEEGRDRVSIAFGTEREPGRRFALWAVLRATGEAPAPHVAFEDPRERRAAETYARIMSVSDQAE